MAAENEREVIVERRVEDNRLSGSLAAVFIVLGVIAAVAFGWWAIGTTPVPSRVSQAPPGATSPDTTVEPRTTVPEGKIEGKAM
ncbi:MAG: hypothetical protein ACKVP3_19760 [Hyphomicrobiaceae bacterium]